jgi:magnesium-transporting ATPase (P-type)
VSAWLNLLHNLKYAKDGYGIPFFDIMGTALRIMAELSFMMLLYLISSGWTVTQPYLRHMRQIIGIFVTLVVLYVSMFAWSQISLAIQITTSDYVYETLPGVLIGVLRIPALGFFIYALKTTYKKEVSQSKLLFYKIFGVIYSIWFVILPLIIILQFVIPVWHRAKWIEGLSRSYELVSYVLMFFLLWYSQARKYFAISEDEQTKGMFEEL